MPLSADQKAMLQLLLERGQSYDDLASILGVGPDEVRTRARAALTELAGANPDRNVALTDYVLGQADPIDRADAVRHLKDDPEDFELVKELSQKLRLVAPEADLPRLPGEERQPRQRRTGTPGPLRKLVPGARAERTSDAAPRKPRTTLTRSQTQAIVLAGCAAVLIAIGALAVAGVFNGGSSASETTASSTTTSAAGTQNLTRVPLKAQDGSGASGVAVFGIANGSQPFIDLKIHGLKPLPSSQTYVTWLLLTPTAGYPLTPVAGCDTGAPAPCLSKNGTFSSRFPIPPAILPVITRVQLVDVSSAPTTTVRSVIKNAVKKKKVVVNKPGTSVLQGAIPKASSKGGSPTG